MNNDTPFDQLVVPVEVPKSIGTLDVISASTFHLPITQYLPEAINPVQGLHNTTMLYTYSMPS